MIRRHFLAGLAALAAPAIVRTPGLLMPVKKLPKEVYGIDLTRVVFSNRVSWVNVEFVFEGAEGYWPLAQMQPLIAPPPRLV